MLGATPPESGSSALKPDGSRIARRGAGNVEDLRSGAAGEIDEPAEDRGIPMWLASARYDQRPSRRANRLRRREDRDGGEEKDREPESRRHHAS
jgi:hypothetical protein